MSATNCRAPKEQNTTSNDASANGSVGRGAEHATGRRPRSRRRCGGSAGAAASRGPGPTGRPPWAPHPARALAGAGADLEHVEARDVAEHAQVGLGVPLRTPDETDVTEELAVRGLVLVGVAVPVGAVGATGLGLGDGTAFDAYARMDRGGRALERRTCRIRGGGHHASVRRLDRWTGTRVDSHLAPGVCWFPDRADPSSLSRIADPFGPHPR